MNGQTFLSVQRIPRSCKDCSLQTVLCAVALTFTERARRPSSGTQLCGSGLEHALPVHWPLQATSVRGCQCGRRTGAQLLCQGHAHLPYIQKAGAGLPRSPWCFGTSAPAKSSVYGSSAPCVHGAFVSTRKLPFISLSTLLSALHSCQLQTLSTHFTEEENQGLGG